MKGIGSALETILSRRSIREFSRRTVPAELVEFILEAGRRAPSPHDTQPWLFVAVSTKPDREALAVTLRDAYLAHLERSGDSEGAVKAERAYRRTLSSPLLVLLCMDTASLRPQPTRSRRRGENIMGTQAVAAAAENMLLAAHALGIGGCWRGAPLFCSGAIRRCLGLPPSVEPQVLLELGYAVAGPKRKRLKPKDEVVRYGLRRR